MPRIALAAADLPLGQRLLAGLRYPLTSGALATCVALALCRYANLLARAMPGLGGVALIVSGRKLHRNDLLLQHGRTWITQLCTAGDARRALGVVQECREIDPAFLPDDPDHAAALARLAARIGMHALAGHLARRFVQRWPQHADAAKMGALIPTDPQPT